MAYVDLAAAFVALRGKSGNVTFRRTPTGLVLMRKARPADPRTAVQVAVRRRMAQAVEAWHGLSLEQAERWKEWAAGQQRVQAATRRAYSPTAFAAFVGLATKFLQVSPGQPIPVEPPAYAFAGDPVSVTARPEPGAVVFAAASACRPTVRVELLLQPLRYAAQAVQPRAFRTQAFADFSAGALEEAVAARPGWYAPAYRFVDAATGQATDLVRLPLVQVAE